MGVSAWLSCSALIPAEHFFFRRDLFGLFVI